MNGSVFGWYAFITNYYIMKVKVIYCTSQENNLNKRGFLLICLTCYFAYLFVCYSMMLKSVTTFNVFVYFYAQASCC